jgi:hypothetical protein
MANTPEGKRLKAESLEALEEMRRMDRDGEAMNQRLRYERLADIVTANAKRMEAVGETDGLSFLRG